MTTNPPKMKKARGLLEEVMRWKNYRHEKPREEHGRVLIRPQGTLQPTGSVHWSQEMGDDWEWLDHNIPQEELLWESKEDRAEAVKAYFDSREGSIAEDVDYLQRELRKRGYAIKRIKEGE